MRTRNNTRANWRTLTAIACLVAVLAASWTLLSANTTSSDSQPGSGSEQSLYNSGRPYIDESPKQLGKRIPQLKDVQPAQSQRDLPMILEKTGGQVDDFFRHVTDLTAREEISLTRLKQDRPSSTPELSGERVHDSYLILRHDNRSRVEISEYRTDGTGDNFDQAVVRQGFLITSGFALSCNYFSSGFQSESTFRYLGDEKVGPHDTYVVVFAQQPERATLSIKMKARDGTPAHVLVQGVAWIDKSNFQIVRMRTDLLAPRTDVGLNQQTTEVTFSKIQLADVTAPLWLPSSVKVFVEFTTHNGDADEFFELSYRNEHRYTDYQRYRVATKVIP